MSVNNIHTINLGKVLLSQSQHRAVRAINMIREYTQRHMHTNNVKIDQELAKQIWARGVRRPPRKITVELIEGDDEILVVPFAPEVETSEPEKPPTRTEIAADTPAELPGESKPSLEDKSPDSISPETDSPSDNQSPQKQAS